jgi:type I restriction enzyme S subunit
MTSEWRECRWGDLATLEYGKRLRGYENRFGPYPVYGTNGPIGWHSEPLCSHPGVIIGRKGAYRGVHYSNKPFFVIDTAFYLEPKIDINLKWAYYELLTHDINRMDSGSAIPSTSRDDFYNLPVRVPPLPIQRRIAAILGALDDKIEVNRRINRTLEAMAGALYKHWFVDFGPFQDGEFVESELGLIPTGWNVMSLDQIADFLNGLPLQKYPPEGEEYLPVIKIAELRRGVTESSGRASPNIERKYIVDDGDILFSWSGSLEVCIWCGGRGALNQHLFKVTSSNYPKWFYHQWIKHYLPEFRAIAAAKATTMGHIQRYHLSEAEVLIPPEDILRMMDETMTPLLDCLIQNNLGSRTLAETRDYLLPRLLSGEIPVEAGKEAVGT